MSNTLNLPKQWQHPLAETTHQATTESKWTVWLASQAKYQTAWFLMSLIVQGVFFLPIPAVLIFSFGAPVYILVITLGLFFANIIGGMSGAGAKAIILLFAASAIIHACLLLLFML